MSGMRCRVAKGWKAPGRMAPLSTSCAGSVPTGSTAMTGATPKPQNHSQNKPRTLFEFIHIIDKLAHPEKHGGDVKDAFTVVVPSLPGYGWSGKPKRPIGPRTPARLFDKLMTDVVKLPNYIAQGGDWGSVFSAFLCFVGLGCLVVLLNMQGWTSPVSF